MKTLIMFLEGDEILPKYLLLEGDYSRWDGLLINVNNTPELQKEFIDFMYHPETGEPLQNWSKDKNLLESKNWDKVAVCVWIP